jgi:hypothetical protein
MNEVITFYERSYYFLWTKLLFSMNEVNIKYLLISLISLIPTDSKNIFIDFLDELGLFIGENPNFTKKKFRSSAVCRDFMALHMIFERCFQVRDFSFWIIVGIGLDDLNGVVVSNADC